MLHFDMPAFSIAMAMCGLCLGAGLATATRDVEERAARDSIRSRRAAFVPAAVEPPVSDTYGSMHW